MQLDPTESLHSNNKPAGTFNDYLTKFKSILQTKIKVQMIGSIGTGY